MTTRMLIARLPRQRCQDAGATAVAGSDLQCAAQFGCAFVHRVDPDAGPARQVEPDPVIVDLDDERAVQGQPNPARSGLAMVDRIEHRLGGDPVRRHLDRGWERGERPVDGHGHVDRRGRLRGEFGGPLAKRLDEPQVIERRWSKLPRQSPDIGEDALGLLLEARQPGDRGIRVAPDLVASHIEADRHRRQGGPDAIVESAANASPLLFAVHDQPFARSQQLVPLEQSVARDRDAERDRDG